MSRTFVSYDRSDVAWVATLIEALEKNGLTVWSDDKILPGEEFDASIDEALANSAKIVVVWSSRSTRSHWVKSEAAEGLARGKLVPVLMESVKIPLKFRRVQAADLSTWEREDDHKEFQKLMAALNPVAWKRGVPVSYGSPDIEEEPPKTKRLIAEVVSASIFFSAHVRLIIDRNVFEIRHINKWAFQVVLVNGIEVARGGTYFEVKSYFQFYVDPGRPLFIELRLKWSHLLGLQELQLLVEEQDVLLHQLPPRPPLNLRRELRRLAILAALLVAVAIWSYNVEEVAAIVRYLLTAK